MPRSWWYCRDPGYHWHVAQLGGPGGILGTCPWDGLPQPQPGIRPSGPEDVHVSSVSSVHILSRPEWTGTAGGTMTTTASYSISTSKLLVSKVISICISGFSGGFKVFHVFLCFFNVTWNQRDGLTRRTWRGFAADFGGTMVSTCFNRTFSRQSSFVY